MVHDGIDGMARLNAEPVDLDAEDEDPLVKCVEGSKLRRTCLHVGHITKV